MEASDNSNLVGPATTTCDTFRKAFLLFGSCHRVYNGGVTDESEIQQLGMSNPLYLNSVVSELTSPRSGHQSIYVLLQR